MKLVVIILRWLAVPVVLAAVAAGCFLAAREAVNIADQRCEYMVGGACVEGWHTGMIEWTIYISVLVALLLMTTLSAWIAPALKRPIAVLAGLLGVGVLSWGYFMTGWIQLLQPVFVAIVAAALGVLLVWRWQGGREVT